VPHVRPAILSPPTASGLGHLWGRSVWQAWNRASHRDAGSWAWPAGDLPWRHSRRDRAMRSRV